MRHAWIYRGEVNLTQSRVAGAFRIAARTTASTLAICAFAAQSVSAQEAVPAEDMVAAAANDEQEGDIVVTGFRAALGSAQSIKRNSDTFVDVITSEDIGALPDRSVAEALQRVPGINISRFEQRNDPDRFSVEGSGVIIRGLPFVRSELNGRDIFSANGGRELSFNDVSPELLGRVEVFKNSTADMVDGGISGTVNLVTRKPLDRPGFNIAGTIEGNYGDLAQEWSPGFSILGSNTFDTGIGTFGIQLAYAQSELVTRTDASQITDPCYRTRTRPASASVPSARAASAVTQAILPPSRRLGQSLCRRAPAFARLISHVIATPFRQWLNGKAATDVHR
jgi:TonB-dependent receptor